MAQLKDLLVNSVAKFLSKVYVSDSVTAPTFIGKLQGNADTATKATSATKADSATTATTANKATLASGVENSGTVSDGVARHVWFSNASDEAKRVSSDNFKYTPNSQMLTTNVSGNAGSATKLQSIRKVDGVNFDGSADITHYGTCSTAAATAAKTVTLNGFNLATGAKVAVKFTVTNTAANPTLNVNGTGAKSIKYRGAAIGTNVLAANCIYEFVYDGTDYVFVGDINTDTNTTYGNMTGATTSAAGKAGLVPAPAAGASTRYLRSDGTWQVPPDTTYNDATTSTHGLMSTSDKSKLDGIASGANKTTVDSALSDSSTNPVQNKVIVSALSGKASNTLLTNENLNSVTTPGFYNASGGNTCTNKPANVDEFGLEVIHTAGGNYYVQILYRKDLSYRRTCSNGTWSAWTTDKLTDTTYSDATQSTHGLMSTADKKKLDGITEGANKITVDSAMSSSSTNPVQNKIVQAALNGKSNTNHTHNYAGSSSAGGVANSATKLATARNIAANDDYIMNFNFDGSGNVSTQLRAYNAIIAVANANNYPYHRFAKLDTLTDSYQDRVTNLLITQDFNGGGWGICRIVLRTNNQSNTLSSASVDWLVRCGLAADSVQIGLYTKDGSTYADAFFKTVGTYWSTTIRNLGSGSRGNIGRTWTFINSSETNNTTTTDKKTSYEVYVSLADAGTALHNQAYTSTITGVDVGTVKYANTSGSATSATSAEKATKDSANQQINSTYIKGISASGKTITVTKGDNTTSTFTTQDTTYGTATNSANGLMSSSDKSKLDSIAAGATKVIVDSALSSTSTNPVQNKVVNTALASKADVTSPSYNTLKANASNTSLVVPDENAIASSPFARDLWHDHFAFLNSHTIQDSQTSTDGTTWTTSTTDLKNLFMQKEYINTTILTEDIKARRFVLYSNDFSWSSILWYEFGVAYTDPFSNFNILIETSADDKKTWTTVANATVESHSNPHFIKGIPFYGNKYLRFTFTKTTNVTTGIVNLTCIKGLTKRKGDQGRGIEYESPYDWNYNRDIYPWVDNVQNLGSSAKKWKNVYATTFTGALSGNASTATKATQDSAGQQINTTYIKRLSASKGVVTYTKGNNSTGTINTQDNFVTLTQAEYNSLASAGKIDENSYYFVTDSANGPKLIQYVTFTASGWTASSDGTYYTQSVTASKITADDEPMIIKNLPYSTGAREAKAYNKAFGILCSGIGETADSKINLKVFKKPTTDISVGLIKIVS